jgi:protein gp37
MGDLFHPCTPREEIDLVLTTIKYTAQHTHIFLTKNPARYQEFNPWPENCWLGATITNQEDADSRTQELFKADARIKFLSAEPLLGEIYLGRAAGLYVRIDQSRGPGNLDISIPSLRWLIIGATTGPGSKDHKPKPEWVQSLIDQARAAGVALFLKDNLNWPEKIQEYPH